MISVGTSAPAQPAEVAQVCTPKHFTGTSFNAVSVGMSLDQVNTIMGCKFSPARTIRTPTMAIYTWAISGTMTYAGFGFDANGIAVISYDGSGLPFKSSGGF